MFRSFRLLEPDTAIDLGARLAEAEWVTGKARTEKATGLDKQNQELIPHSDNEPFWKDAMAVKEAVMKNGALLNHAILYKMTIPKFNRYTEGMAYNRHYDACPMTSPEMRTDLACTVFLSDPDDYEGGVLTLEDISGNLVEAPRGEPGTCVIYECGNAHRVTPVTKGARISSFMWMRSQIRNPKQRWIISKFARILMETERTGDPIEAYSEDYTTLTGIQTELLRMWSDA